MSIFSKISEQRLETCHPDLQILFNEVIKYFDISVIYGHRNKEEQELAFNEHRSQKHFPYSFHNSNPSMAIDVAPYPYDGKDERRFTYLSGHVMLMAKLLKEQNKITHDVRWGGDWDNDTEVKDNKFNDLGHFELIV